MRPLFKRLDRQRGLALLIILIIVVLGTMTVLVSSLNSTNIQIAKQKQTMLALAQAKAALLGFAASYAETHPGQPVGYLPCPDQTGDGSVDVATTGASPCSTAGKTILGRFPWRTLGLPPLRDGDGECLWYAVSGNYKDNPKVTLTSDTNGLLIVRDASGNIVAGSSPENRAIAIIFAPGKPVGNQIRGGNNGSATECGRVSAPADDINQASNYLESLAGINNADGGGTLEGYGTTNRIFHNDTPLGLSTFVMGSLTKTSSNTGSTLFNDTLMLITPQDYQSIYTRMNLWVAKKATDCIANYEQNNETTYLTNPDYIDTIEDYKAHFNDEVQRYADLKEMQLLAKFNKAGKVLTSSDITTERDKAIQNVIELEKKYPWAARVDDIDDAVYIDEPGERFGRIPTTLTNVGSDMKSVWSDTAGDCFDESDRTFNNNKWSWWDEWKKMVFYTINWKNVPERDTFFWIKLESTKCGNCSSSTCKVNVDNTSECWMSWVADVAAPIGELTNADTSLMEQKDLEIAWSNVMETKRETFAKIVEDDGVWEWDTVCTSSYHGDDYLCRTCTPSQSHASACGPTPSELNLTTIKKDGSTSGSIADFIVLVTGRSLSLNSYQQIRDSTMNSDWFWVKNYLEDDNIPGTGEVDTIPSGDEIFVIKPITSSFNDVACMNGSWNCLIP